jgi:hypothetical protein
MTVTAWADFHMWVVRLGLSPIVFGGLFSKDAPSHKVQKTAAELVEHYPPARGNEAFARELLARAKKELTIGDYYVNEARWNALLDGAEA